uniref:Proteasome-associated protein ECM29 homolog isoform X1 n=1 Tax=Rhizophora mucronata TaxID=61149 RepID=A0A2P2M9F4_RHIMU
MLSVEKLVLRITSAVTGTLPHKNARASPAANRMSSTFDLERLKIKSMAVLRCEVDVSFAQICPRAITIFWTALLSSPESSLLNFACKYVRT